MDYQIVPVLLLALSFLGAVLALNVPHWFSLNKPHILGGKPADIKDFPYQVSLRKRGSLYGQGHVCGASILNERYVLTAAHCVQFPQMPNLYFVVAGSTKLEGGKVTDVEKIRIHNKYQKTNPYEFDVAVIKLREPLVFGITIKAIPLVPVGKEPPTGSKVIVAGWGRTIPGNKNPELDFSDLMKLEMEVVDRNVCDICLGGKGLITKRLICAGLDGTEKKDSSKGDSGGPLVDTKTGMQIGVVSFGAGDLSLQCPGAYTNLADSETRKFIDDVLGN